MKGYLPLVDTCGSFHINAKRGFTLIELLISIGVLAVLSSGVLYVIGQGPAQAARDARRKADLEKVVSGLEFYRNAAGTYPRCQGNARTCVFSSIINNAGLPAVNLYIPAFPSDPQSGTRSYKYSPFDINGGACTAAANDRCVRYMLCAATEKGAGNIASCDPCGSVSCNYSTTSP